MSHDDLNNNGVLGVTVRTWGTKASKGNGMLNFMDQQLFGGDVGHASINMKLPINESTKKWIETYCCKETYEQYKARVNRNIDFEQYIREGDKIIPVTIDEQRVRQATYDDARNLKVTSDNAFVQQYFDVDFSWWPGNVGTTASDMILEREGKHVNYVPEWKDYLQPVQRVHRGKLGQRSMDYAPLVVAHQRDLPDFVMNRMEKRSELEKIEEKKRAISNLEKKINDLKSDEVSPTIQLMFKNISLDLEGILEEYQESQKQGEVIELKDFLNNKVYQFSRELKQREDELLLELEGSMDVSKLRERREEILRKITDIEGESNLLKEDIRAQELYQLLTDPVGEIPYSGKLQSLVDKMLDVKEMTEVKNLNLSTASIDHLLKMVDQEIETSSQKAKKGNVEQEARFKKYQEILTEYPNDRDAQREAIWGEIEDDEADEFDKLISEGKTLGGSVEISPELASLKALLLEHKASGMEFTPEVETKLNGSLRNWRNELPEPCQIINPDNVPKLIQYTKLLMDTKAENETSLDKQRLELLTELQKINTDLEYYGLFEDFFNKHRDLYFTLGEPAHHSVSLPYATAEKRGLDPEQMLKKMHELIAVDKEKFDLYRKNCSLTSIEVLKAGTQHDVTLNQAMDTYAFGFFGTPQQVLANAEKSLNIIDKDKHNNAVTEMVNKKYIERALGKGIELFMDKEGGELQKAAGVVLILLAGTAKFAKESAKAIAKPNIAFDNLTEALNLVYERDSTILKVGATILLVPALAVTGLMAGIQKGLQLVVSPIQDLLGKPKIKESMDEITTPVVSSSQRTEAGNSYSNTALAALLNKRVKSKLDENTIEVSNLGTPVATLQEFQRQLDDNPHKVVILSKAAHDKLLTYVLNTDNAEHKQQFYDACKASAKRAQSYAPQTKDEVIAVLADVIKAKVETVDENQNDKEDILEADQVPQGELRASMK